MTTVQASGVDSSRPSDLARLFLALADPIRLRMLLLMFSAELCPEQLAQTLGVEPKTVMKHLVYFRDSKLITVRTHKHTRYYGIRRQAPSQQAQLVELVIQMLAYDSAIRAAVAIVRSPLPEHTETTVEEEPSTPRSPSITP